VPDGIVAIQNAHFMFEDDHPLLYGYAQSTTIQRARIVTPKLRQISLPFVRPIRLGTVPGAEPRVSDYRDRPLVLRQREEFAVEISQGGAGAEQATAIFGLAWPSMGMAPNGDVITFRGSSVTAAGVNIWTLITMTFADILPWGDYVVVGAAGIGTTSMAYRFTFENQFPRPGVIANAAAGDQQHSMFRNGGLGVFGRFHSTRMPLVEVFASTAIVAHEVYLDLIRVG
jgi:hypothetical protein